MQLQCNVVWDCSSLLLAHDTHISNQVGFSVFFFTTPPISGGFFQATACSDGGVCLCASRGAFSRLPRCTLRGGMCGGAAGRRCRRVVGPRSAHVSARACARPRPGSRAPVVAPRCHHYGTAAQLRTMMDAGKPSFSLTVRLAKGCLLVEKSAPGKGTAGSSASAARIAS